MGELLAAADGRLLPPPAGRDPQVGGADLDDLPGGGNARGLVPAAGWAAGARDPAAGRAGAAVGERGGAKLRVDRGAGGVRAAERRTRLARRGARPDASLHRGGGAGRPGARFPAVHGARAAGVVAEDRPAADAGRTGVGRWPGRGVPRGGAADAAGCRGRGDDRVRADDRELRDRCRARRVRRARAGGGGVRASRERHELAAAIGVLLLATTTLLLRAFEAAVSRAIPA
jgi:hypothetical protein